jgi:hypothetical protein
MVGLPERSGRCPDRSCAESAADLYRVQTLQYADGPRNRSQLVAF